MPRIPGAVLTDRLLLREGLGLVAREPPLRIVRRNAGQIAVASFEIGAREAARPGAPGSSTGRGAFASSTKTASTPSRMWWRRRRRIEFPSGQECGERSLRLRGYHNA
jgi:hypothetical protein